MARVEEEDERHGGVERREAAERDRGSARGEERDEASDRADLLEADRDEDGGLPFGGARHEEGGDSVDEEVPGEEPDEGRAARSDSEEGPEALSEDEGGGGEADDREPVREDEGLAVTVDELDQGFTSTPLIAANSRA